jgi:hypothetical protein
MASNKSLPISAGLPRKPARTGTTASGARADSSKAWIRRSMRLTETQAMSVSRMRVPAAVSGKAAIPTFRELARPVR